MGLFLASPSQSWVMGEKNLEGGDDNCLTKIPKTAAFNLFKYLTVKEQGRMLFFSKSTYRYYSDLKLWQRFGIKEDGDLESGSQKVDFIKQLGMPFITIFNHTKEDKINLWIAYGTGPYIIDIEAGQTINYDQESLRSSIPQEIATSLSQMTFNEYIVTFQLPVNKEKNVRYCDLPEQLIYPQVPIHGILQPLSKMGVKKRDVTITSQRRYLASNGKSFHPINWNNAKFDLIFEEDTYLVLKQKW